MDEGTRRVLLQQMKHIIEMHLMKKEILEQTASMTEEQKIAWFENEIRKTVK